MITIFRREFSGVARITVVAALVCFLGCGGGGGGFSIPAFNLPFSIAAADLNNDGALDLAVATTFVAGSPPHPGFASVILQNKSAPGTFARGVHYGTGTDPISIAVGDLNGDGSLDLAVANQSSGNVSVLLQSPANSGTFVLAVNLSTGGSPQGVAIADIDRDGRPDIAVATGRTNVLVFLQNPSGPPATFLQPVSVPLNSPSSSVDIGDINGDGRPDLAVTENHVIAVLLQNPLAPGTFQPEQDFVAGQQPLAIKIGDLNGDGRPDLTVANFGSPSNPSTASVSVLLQDPVNPGSFLPVSNYQTGDRSSGVAIGDLNGDGKPDLVVANSGAGSNRGSVSVLLQNTATPGTFLPAVNYAGVSGPQSVAVGDLNGDSKPDIAVADGNSATVMFQQPSAAGTFAPPVQVGD